MRWDFPKEDSLVINLDVVWKNGKNCAAMVVRDYWGKAKLVAATEI